MSNIFDQKVRQIQKPGEEESRTGSDAESRLFPTTPADVAGAVAGDGNGESPRTPTEIKSVIQELLRQGYVEESERAEMFRRAVTQAAAVGRALEPLDLAVRLDTHRGIAFLTTLSSTPMAVAESNPSDDEGWSHPLVRKQRLTLEQSLLVAILRQAFVQHEQERGVGVSPARTSVEELLATFTTFFGDSGSDSKNENRLLQLLDQLKAHGIVSEVDKQQEITIRPLIAHVANPESLAALLAMMKAKSQESSNHGES